ncbi:hypothetical protein ACFL27_18625, partial [candidate division CSSED10-310 bacterium]
EYKVSLSRLAGSPAAYKISFTTWELIIDYLFYDVLAGIKKSSSFAELAEILGSEAQSKDENIQIIYDYLSREFQVVPLSGPSHRYAPTVKDLNKMLSGKFYTPFALGFICWDVHIILIFRFVFRSERISDDNFVNIIGNEG